MNDKDKAKCEEAASMEEDLENAGLDPSILTPDHAPEEKGETETQIAQLQEKLLRLQADFDNYRKRITREKEDSIRFANEGLLEQLLPVIDNFELGLSAAETATDAKSIAQGMQMVKSQLKRFLEDCGVQEINATGSIFDPNLHEAVSQEISHDQPEGTVLTQRRKGYRLRDRLLRPAIVVVAHAPVPETSTEPVKK
jgi:molecular chaperone GrpE